MKTSNLLGLNARTQEYSYRYNKAKGRRIASSKLYTKKTLAKSGIPVPESYAKFTKPRSILNFDWTALPGSFVIKPNTGLGGEGIIVVKKRARGREGWITTKKSFVTAPDFQLHVLDILEGAHSLRNEPGVAFVEEYIARHKAFRRYSYRGTPDIRVIVFNKVPVMAMLRLPTKESGGRANLHQGAIGVGIDIATGITTHAVYHGKYIKYKPGTKRKLHGIKIPFWTKILRTSVEAQQASALGFVSVDFLLHPEKGPMVLELNYQPGLQIQLANRAGLKKRLERVEDLVVRDADHGVNIAKALFMAHFADRVRAKEGVRTISTFEEIKIKGTKRGQRKKVIAKVDTGAWRTSISEGLARELGLLEPANVLWTKQVKSALGQEERPVIGLTFWMAGRKVITPASVAKRMALKYQVIIGRKNLKGFLVSPEVKK